MQNSSNIPLHLFEIQSWFGKTISQAICEDHHLPPANAEKYIKPSKMLSPHQRIELYHQQYWWRLLKCMHTNFPTLTRIFGYHAFNQEIAIPFLAECPPDHWALCHLGHNLPAWLEAHYMQKDREFVLDVCKIDRAAQSAFSVKEHPAFNAAGLSENVMTRLKLGLQSHLHLFCLQGDLFSFRDQLLQQEVDHWNKHSFPEIVYGEQYFVIYRHPRNFVAWKKLCRGEYRMLCSFRNGTTIQQACELIEQTDKNEAEEQLPFWFQEWTVLNWLCQWSEKCGGL